MNGQGDNRSQGPRSSLPDPVDAAVARRAKLAVVGDRTTRSIVDRLLIEPASAAEIAADLRLEPQAVRHLLRKLVKSEVVKRKGKSRRRGVSEFLYSCDALDTQLSSAELSQLRGDQVAAAVTRVVRELFRETMMTIEAGSFFRAETINVRFPIPLDETGWPQAYLVHKRLLESVSAAAEDARARLAGGAELIEATAAILFFEIPGSRWPLPFVEVDSPPESIRRRSNSRRFDAVAALQDPLRAKIVDALSLRPASAVDLAEEIGAPLERVRYELRALDKASMVRIHSRRERRGAVENVFLADSRNMTFYREDVPAADRLPKGEWGVRWAHLVFRDAVEGIRGGSFEDRMDWHVSRVPLRLDRRGFVEISSAMDTALEKLFDLRDECLARMEAGSSVAPPAFSNLVLFERAASIV